MNINLTLIGQTVIFFVFVWFCMKFVWPPLVAAMNTRREKIADGLAAAEQGHKDKELALKKAEEIVKEAKDKASQIISQANIRDNEMIEKAKEKAKEEAATIKNHAESEIVSDINSAREQLRKEISSLVLDGVQKIISREVKVEDHQDILSKLGTKI